MTDHDKLMAAVMNPSVTQACQTFIDELVAATQLVIHQAPRAFGYVSLREHDARVTELLDANNREVERRREAEAKAERFQFDVLAAIQALPLGGGSPVGPTVTPAPIEGRCRECNVVAACVVTCGQRDCPVIAARKAAA